MVTFQYIYREHNSEDDSLSKRALALLPSFMHYEKAVADSILSEGSFALFLVPSGSAGPYCPTFFAMFGLC